MIPLPEIIAVRAWDCAYVLSEDFADYLTLQQRVTVETARIAGPEAIGWEYAGRLLAMHTQIVGVRV